ncbi:site-specific integrase [Microtetraspora niveoalba]|uniref:site-specific integrase n=1 Tax=Microtetraspora niveoalba TaxID=46175 RepID=UPI000A5FFF4C|nr:site-specific integrase [Microtetraspora niveoalba]
MPLSGHVPPARRSPVPGERHRRAGVPGRPPRPRLRQASARGRRLCPATGRGRLSYPRAEYLFKTASADLVPHGEGWTLHQLRHSALTHLAAAGRTAPELQAKSRHQHLSSLGRCVRLGEETSARITAEHDPAARRRKR